MRRPFVFLAGALAGVVGVVVMSWRERARPPVEPQIVTLPVPLTIGAPSPPSKRTSVSVQYLIGDLHGPPSDEELPLVYPTPRSEKLAWPHQRSESFYIGGLEDERTGRRLVSTQLTHDDREMLDADCWLVRAAVPLEAGEDFVTAYLVEVSFCPGAAHRNYDISCATFDRKTGKRLQLADFVGKRAAADITRMDAGDMHVDPTSLRVEGFAADYDRKLILCLKDGIEAEEMFVEEHVLLDYPDIFDAL